MEQSRELLALALEAVLAGEADLRMVLADPTRARESLEACFHGLQHFLADDDIRAKYSWYQDIQENEMRKLIRLLRSNADEATLSQVSFLGVSRV